MYCDTKHETNNCYVNFTFETKKKLNAKHLKIEFWREPNTLQYYEICLQM